MPRVTAGASLSVFATLLVSCAGAARTVPVVDPRDALVDLAIREYGDFSASIYFASVDGSTIYERDAEVWRPAASAIKTAYLIELFGRHADSLDTPIGAVASIVGADDHPSIRHFSSAQRDEIRAQLTGASARRLGELMIRGTDVSNVVYNAAANVVTALFGGPAELTRAIRSRHGAAGRGFAVRRYMLARRDVTGDNELTARALGNLWQGTARGEVAGLSDEALVAAREILRLPAEPNHLFKGGALDSHPSCRLRSGMIERSDGARLVYVVALTSDLERDEREPGMGARLDAAAREITSGLIVSWPATSMEAAR